MKQGNGGSFLLLTAPACQPLSSQHCERRVRLSNQVRLSNPQEGRTLWRKIHPPLPSATLQGEGEKLTEETAERLGSFGGRLSLAVLLWSLLHGHLGL